MVFTSEKCTAEVGWGPPPVGTPEGGALRGGLALAGSQRQGEPHRLRREGSPQRGPAARTPGRRRGRPRGNGFPSRPQRLLHKTRGSAG